MAMSFSDPSSQATQGNYQVSRQLVTVMLSQTGNDVVNVGRGHHWREERIIRHTVENMRFKLRKFVQRGPIIRQPVKEWLEATCFFSDHHQLAELRAIVLETGLSAKLV
jgi:hypothetical protein